MNIREPYCYLCYEVWVKKSILKCCLPTIARFWQPLRYIHVTSTYKNILFDERKSDDFNKLIWRIPASPNTDRFLWRWFHRKAQDPTKATNWNNHNVHKNYMKWLVQSNLQVILVIQWMYHYNLGRMTRNPTRRKTSSKVSYEPLLSHIGITKLLRVPLQLPLGSTGSKEGWSMSIHKVWSWIFHHRTSGWSTKSGHQPEVLVNIFPSILLGFSDSLYFSITPRWGSLGSQVLKIHHFPLKKKHPHRQWIHPMRLALTFRDFHHHAFQIFSEIIHTSGDRKTSGNHNRSRWGATAWKTTQIRR